jgi:thiamine-monophosphate kinase
MLVRDLPVASMIDISDGLASEIRHLCGESGLGCRVDEETIPVSEEALRWAREKKCPVLPYTLESGEEYELLFTVPRQAVDAIGVRVADTAPCPVTVIGEMRPEAEGIRLQWGGSLYPLETHGWDHFRRNG